MLKLSEILRLLSLAVLFGGGAAVVFVAIVLVRAAREAGVEVSEAAARNAPAFIEFARVAAVCAMALLLSEGLDMAAVARGMKKKSRLLITRYATSILAVAATFVFAFFITPPMKRLQPSIKTDTSAHAEFRKLHEISRGVFGAVILFSMISLVLPCLESKTEKGK
ncbi:MAG: DUF4149 domain-containing protein [Cyanobacteria bacterium HKST-UBA02]|nr:DUF4149 domain-containing protein [Cyanobacteria bacterium HKST-UBA02]